MPYIRQFLGALGKFGIAEVFETERFDPSLARRAVNKYLGTNSNSAQFRELEKLPRDPDLVMILHDYEWLRGDRLSFLRRSFPTAKVWFYDYEVPLNLPENATNPHYGTSPFLRKTNRWDMVDGLVIPSKGALGRTKELTEVSNIITLYFSVDPDFYKPQGPTSPAQNYDLCFMGKSRYYRENEIEYMLDRPVQLRGYTSLDLSDGAFNISQFIKNAGMSRLNLSITRRPFADCFASSVSRPFELAAMGSCIVSNPCLGMEEWFEKGREIEVVSSNEEAIALYDALLSDPERRERLGRNARDRVLAQHDVKLRVRAMLAEMGFEAHAR